MHYDVSLFTTRGAAYQEGSIVAMLNAEMLERARAALEALARQEAKHLGRESPNGTLLKELRPVIVAARSKRHSWKRIAESLRTIGISVTGETVRRHTVSGKPKRQSAANKAKDASSTESRKLKSSEDVPAGGTVSPSPRTTIPQHQGATRRPKL